MRTLIAIVILLLAALFQNSSVFLLFGVKPNLVLAAFAALAFYSENLAQYLLAIALPVIFIRFNFNWQTEPLLIGALGLAAYFLIKRLPWNPLVNVLVFTGGATVILYLFFDNLLLAATWPVLTLELIYNLVFTALFFYLFSSWQKSSMLKI